MPVEDWDLIAVKSDGVRWRIFEHECCQIHFGTVGFCRPEGAYNDRARIQECHPKTIYWKLHTESTPPDLLEQCVYAADYLKGVKHINDPRGWINCHAKEKAFEVWQKAGIPCPRWFEFQDEKDFSRRRNIEYPMLIRFNNSTGGNFSFLCRKEIEVKRAILSLQMNMNYSHDNMGNAGTGRKLIAVEFINAVRPERVNMSFRIIVAGNGIVTGYARLGRPSDWVAITNRFEPWMENLFIKYQKVCQRFCEDNEALLVKAVKSLGLNFQGVDVILDRNDNPYFIEVQPGFSVGVANIRAWRPPFYNPSKPEVLRDFLIKNLDRLKREIPLYANFWLDKYAMFNKAFRLLKEDLHG